MPKFTYSKTVTVKHGGNRWTPIMLEHDGHREMLIMVRTDEDEGFSIADALTTFLNDRFDSDQMPAYNTPHALSWLANENGWSAKHPDFEKGMYSIHSFKGIGFEAKLSDGADLVNIGAFPSLAFAQNACEANLATNRAMRKV